ncbi:MAG: GNAT family N-acetyltransferase [Tannerellaceae bacterium]|jgi:RimJ/RimL family protein N-acetyltransferase|nr:GNAT family N-acetyltransferase [Tannerellaceae bacterium]
MNTTNFELRKWQLSDAVSLAENANNIHIWNNVRDYFPNPYSEKEGRQFIEMALAKPAPATDMAIVIDGKAVGGIGITPQTDVERISAEIGYWLGENYWNRGVMTAAVKEMTEYAFLNFRELRKIYAPVFDFNDASQRVLQKAGFKREGVFKQAAIKNGKTVDLHYYSMLKSQWRQKVMHRFFTQDDFPLLEDLLYEAIFQPEGAEPLPRDVIKKPYMDIYIRDFGKRQGDFCVFSELNGKTVGGAWLRRIDGKIKGYGYVDSQTPELVIAVFKKYRSLGIGTGLMYNIIELALINGTGGYKQISLSVDKTNYAVKMYKNFGFEIAKENERDYIMVLKQSRMLQKLEMKDEYSGKSSNI